MSQINTESLPEEFSSSNNPIKFLKQNGKEGLKVIKELFSTIALIALTNFILFSYSVYSFFSASFSSSKLLFLIIAISFCLLFFSFGLSKSYRYVIVKALNIAYDKMNTLMKKICTSLIDTAESLFSSNANATSKDLKKAINIQHFFTEKFNKLPTFITKRIVKIITRLPIIEILLDLKKDIVSGDKSAASHKLFSEIDNKIRETAFESNDRKWLLWLLPLNIIIVLSIVYLKLN